MLQRAASNAYTWWWASHIRTKQSKWLEQNLQDMEEKIKNMVNLIEEDGDSFAKRAEMYYRRRPELINFVEETFKAYRALADRYDHMSRDLQNANNTIATVFPEQLQFAMEDDEDEISSGGPPFITNENKIPKSLPQPPKLNIPKLPVSRRKSAKNPSREVKLRKTNSSISRSGTTTTSSKSTAEALQKIDRLQKGILALQTEKEFVKSSYEGGVAKYWEIEKQISEMQEEVCSLQDEFGVATVIDDDEARTLMAATALKSCQETLVQLQEKQEKSAEETRVEYQRIKDAHEKLHTIKNEFLSDQIDQSELSDKKEAMSSGSGLNNLEPERLKLESIQEKIREHIDINSDTFLTVTEMAEKIDELVHEVITLETAISSQNALIKRLRSETDELQGKLRDLDEKKGTSVKGSDELINEMRKLDRKLSGIQDLHQSVEDQNNNLQTHFTETRCNLSYLSEKLHSVKPDEEIDIPSSPYLDIFCEAQKQKDMVTRDNGFENRKVRKEKAEEEKIALQSLSPYSRENEETSTQSMESSSVCDASEEREHPENQKIVEKQGVSQSKDDILKVDSESNHNLNHLSQGLSDLNYPGKELHSAKPGEEILDSIQDNVDKKESSKSEENILKFDSEGNLDSNNLSQKLHSAKSDEDVKISPQEKTGVVIDDAMHAKLEGQEEMMAFSNEPRSSMERKTEVEDKTDEEDGAYSKFSSTIDDISESSEVSGQPDNVEKDNKSETQGLEQKAMEEQRDEPNWQKLFLSGLEDKEKVLLGEYTASLRNCKDAKRKLSELEKENQESTSKMMVQLRELKSVNAIKDDEIKSLRQKLGFLQTSFEGNPEANNLESKDTQQGNQHPVINLLDDQNVEVAETSEVRIANGAMESNPPAEDEEEKIKVILVDEPHQASTIEEKFRRDIDVLLEENLDFWLKFSALVPQVQKFQNSIQDLQIEISKLKDKNKQEGNTSTNKSLKSDALPIYKHLREIQTELTLWLENNAMLKEEIRQRLSSLCQILEEISKVANSGSKTEEVKSSSYQAARFQGEVMNMQQENNRVADQLQSGVDHARELQDEIEKTLSKLNEDFGLSGPKIETDNHQQKPLGNKNRVPLRSFIFGVKSKKQRSFFKCINPTFHRQQSDDLSSGLPP